MAYRPKSHQYLFLILEFTNWGMYLAVWIALSVNIGQDDFCVNFDGSRSFVRPCDTIYATIAFAITNWILYTATLATVTFGILTGGGEESAPAATVVGPGPGPLKTGNDETLSPA